MENLRSVNGLLIVKQIEQEDHGGLILQKQTVNGITKGTVIKGDNTLPGMTMCSDYLPGNVVHYDMNVVKKITYKGQVYHLVKRENVLAVEVHQEKRQ